MLAHTSPLLVGIAQVVLCRSNLKCSVGEQQFNSHSIINLMIANLLLALDAVEVKYFLGAALLTGLPFGVV